MRALRLQHRIVIPFVIVALVSTAAAAFVALRVSSEALQSRVQAQLLSASAVASRADMALNPAILQNLREVTGAHVMTFGDGGRVVAGTADSNRPELVAATARAIAEGSEAAATPSVSRMDCGGVPCLVVFRRVQGHPNFVVALVAETSELTSTTQAVARAIVLAAGLSVVVMVLVSQAVVKRVTAPLGRLVQFVGGLSPDHAGARAEVGRNEIGALAEAFNGMLDRLERSQGALVRSEKLALAGVMAARVAHDIRNPLFSIKMQTQLLRARSGGDAEQEATLTAVLHDIEQVESVIRDLLELARPGELRLEAMSINDVVREALDQMAAQFAHRKISVDARLDDEIPSVMLDRSRFKQALLNLLVNASEAMPTGGELMVMSRPDGSSALIVRICDDGIGVDPAILERAFDPFVSTKRDGVGLGLVNVKAVVEGHGGRISLQPRDGRGTCAVITMPVHAAAHDDVTTRGMRSDG